MFEDLPVMIQQLQQYNYIISITIISNSTNNSYTFKNINGYLFDVVSLIAFFLDATGSHKQF